MEFSTSYNLIVWVRIHLTHTHTHTHTYTICTDINGAKNNEGWAVSYISVTVTGTEDPSRAPTSAPVTNDPTRAPTQAPNLQPTREPTDIPTHAPVSESPTRVTTNVPTFSPTLHPSRTPTDIPTHAPTNEPTHYPTDSNPCVYSVSASIRDISISDAEEVALSVEWVLLDHWNQSQNHLDAGDVFIKLVEINVEDTLGDIIIGFQIKIDGVCLLCVLFYICVWV